MRKEGKGEERDTTTHMIKFQVFTHASHVTNFSTHNTVQVHVHVQVQLVAFALLEAWTTGFQSFSCQCRSTW